jgi:hypothetical protein
MTTKTKHGRTIHLGHSRPMHSVPVPINVRCFSHSDIIVRRSEVTRRAISDRLRCAKTATFSPSDHCAVGHRTPI